MDEIENILGSLEPIEAGKAIAKAAKAIFPLLDEDERRNVITQMLGEPGEDRVVGLVHL